VRGRVRVKFGLGSFFRGKKLKYAHLMHKVPILKSKHF
jgi:hypothetical protein